MKVTEVEPEYRQLRIEDFLNQAPAEQGGETEVYASQMITENNATITWKKSLLEGILSDSNLKKAIKKVKANKGAAGIDGMEVGELDSYFEKMCIRDRLYAEG